MEKKLFLSYVKLKGKSVSLRFFFFKNDFASNVNSSKCLHATSSNALFCTHYVDDVMYHIFSHGDVSIWLYGKNINFMKESTIIHSSEKYFDSNMIHKGKSTSLQRFQITILQRTLTEVNVYMRRHQTRPFALTMLTTWIILVWSR